MWPGRELVRLEIIPVTLYQGDVVVVRRHGAISAWQVMFQSGQHANPCDEVVRAVREFLGQETDDAVQLLVFPVACSYVEWWIVSYLVVVVSETDDWVANAVAARRVDLQKVDGSVAPALNRLVTALGRLDPETQSALPAAWLDEMRDYTAVSQLGIAQRRTNGAKPFFVVQPLQLV
jgi:hypothetical protein